MSAAFIIAVATPVVLAMALTVPRMRAIIVRFVWAAPLPALALALLPSPSHLPLDWLLLGGAVGIDVAGRTFLVFTVLLWIGAGAFARHYLRGDDRLTRFLAFFLVTMGGNLGLLVAQDLATFYAAFAVMTFAGYGLIVHTGSADARRAGRIYLVTAVLGETMLLAGLILAGANAAGLGFAEIRAAIATADHRDLIVGLLLGGFGIKAGAIPLHFWLPLAHPVAPTPASAVLSGAMIKAGLLGWMRFLPAGELSMEGWGALLAVAGLFAAFFGVIAGILQREPKTALAYSSISQMGFINIALGAGLASANAWPLAMVALLAYAVHHGLAKGALFLGVAVVQDARTARERRAAMIGMLFAALALAGAPLTSGAIAKGYLKGLSPLTPVHWPISLDLLLGLAAVGTTLLMARVLTLVAAVPAHAPSDGRGRSPLWPGWVGLLIAVATVVWFVPAYHDLEAYPPSVPSAGELWTAIWPVVGGILLASLVALAARRRRLPAWEVPAGDLVIPLERVGERLARRLQPPTLDEAPHPVVSLSSMWYGVYAEASGRDRLHRVEHALTRWQLAGVLFLIVVLLMVALLARGGHG